MEPVSQQAEYVEAFRSVRLAKNLTSLAILLAIAAQLFAFAVVRFGGMIDAAPQLAPAVTTMAAYDSGAADRAKVWYDVLVWATAASKFLAVVAAMLLTLSVLFSVKLALVGRLGGVAGLVSAFFWSLILLATLIPWQQVLASGFSSGATFDLSYIIKFTKDIRPEWGQPKTDWLVQILYYARFIAYPVVALLVWLVVQVKFCKGCGKARSAGTIIPIAPPSQT